jgi:hypothetical protein
MNKAELLLIEAQFHQACYLEALAGLEVELGCKLDPQRNLDGLLVADLREADDSFPASCAACGNIMGLCICEPPEARG